MHPHSSRAQFACDFEWWFHMPRYLCFHPVRPIQLYGLSAVINGKVKNSQALCLCLYFFSCLISKFVSYNSASNSSYSSPFGIILLTGTHQHAAFMRACVCLCVCAFLVGQLQQFGNTVVLTLLWSNSSDRHNTAHTHMCCHVGFESTQQAVYTSGLFQHTKQTSKTAKDHQKCCLTVSGKRWDACVSCACTKFNKLSVV